MHIILTDFFFLLERTQAHANIGTRTLTTMFLRLHNFLCDVLSWLNPSWDDEVMFQEARRLLVAMYQHIVYYEFLPTVIGTYRPRFFNLKQKIKHYNYNLGYEYAKRYDLTPKKSKLFETYDPNINPTTVNSFSTAAFRYFHAIFPASVR